VRRRRRQVGLTLAGVVAVSALLFWPRPTARTPASSASPPAPTTTIAASTPVDANAFAAGACVALSPTSGNRHETVVLDAGHGGLDPGAVGTTTDGRSVNEGALNLPIELDTARILRAAGFRVVVTRTASTSIAKLTPSDVDGQLLTVQGSHNEVVARVQCANMAQASALVGLYLDSGSAGEAGCVTVYDADRPFAAANQRLAQLLQTDVLSAMNRQGWAIPDGGAVPDTNYGSSLNDPSSALAQEAKSYHHLLELGPADGSFNPSPSTMPGAVIEPLFLTDPFEATIAANPSDQEIIAQAVAAAVSTFLSPAVPSGSGSTAGGSASS
jgi:N-acetylmuramoyl-L-alanine amidase